jgi:hypothetical protein
MAVFRDRTLSKQKRTAANMALTTESPVAGALTRLGCDRLTLRGSIPLENCDHFANGSDGQRPTSGLD